LFRLPPPPLPPPRPPPLPPPRLARPPLAPRCPPPPPPELIQPASHSVHAETIPNSTVELQRARHRPAAAAAATTTSSALYATSVGVIVRGKTGQPLSRELLRSIVWGTRSVRVLQQCRILTDISRRLLSFLELCRHQSKWYRMPVHSPPSRADRAWLGMARN